VLGIPEGYLLGILPGSDTGAFEGAMWSLLGSRPVTVLVWESFSKGWATDVDKQLNLSPTILEADYGKLPDLGGIDWSNDVVFVANGTTSFRELGTSRRELRAIASKAKKRSEADLRVHSSVQLTILLCT